MGFNIGKWAQGQADKYIAAQIAAIQQSQKLYTDELNKAAQERVKQGQALASWMQGMNFPSRVQGVYQTAGSDIAGYASGFGGEMRDIANADAAENTNMVSGTGQEGAVRNEGQGMSDVLYGAYGWSPAKKFAETGAAYGADAALQPAFAAQFAQAEAIKQQQEGMGALKDFALKMAEARSGKMDLVEKFKGMRTDAQGAAFERKMDILKWQSDEHYRRFMIYREQGKMVLANRELALAQRKQKQAEMEANRQFGLDVRQENRLNKPEGAKKPSIAQARDSMKDVVEAQKKIVEEVVAAIKTKAWTPSAGRSAERKALVNRLFKSYSYLALTPQAKQRLKQIIMQAVNEAGRLGPQAGAGSGDNLLDAILNSS
jgi:hypothetical protein